MSATQSWSGPSAVKFRSTRSTTGRASAFRRVVFELADASGSLAPQIGFLLHQPGHPLLADHLTRLLQLGVEPRPAVHLPVLVVGLPDLEHQLRVSLRPGRGRTAHPSVVAAGGESQHAAHRPNRIVGLIRLHELEPRSGIELLSRANQAAAFFRISCSMRSPLFSRLSCRSSSRSSVVSPSLRRPSSRSACLTQFPDRSRRGSRTPSPTPQLTALTAPNRRSAAETPAGTAHVYLASWTPP